MRVWFVCALFAMMNGAGLAHARALSPFDVQQMVIEEGSGANAIPHDYTRKYVADVLRWQRVYSQEVFGQARVGQPSIDWFQRSERSVSRPRVPNRIDPLEYDDWATTERRRIERRR